MKKQEHNKSDSVYKEPAYKEPAYKETRPEWKALLPTTQGLQPGTAIYVGSNPDVRKGILEILMRKSGCRPGISHLSGATGYKFFFTGTLFLEEIHGAYEIKESLQEITLAELEAMPDYTKPEPKKPTKKMTVAEVAAMVGCDVEIVKG